MNEIISDERIRQKFVGLNKKITNIEGKKIIPINFDNAATTPTFKSVLYEITRECEMYGSIGRGLGQKSEYTTHIYNECREYLLEYFSVPKDKYTAIFVNNATDGLNRLSRILINENTVVITSRMEHHANDLPWRDKCYVDYIEVDELGRLKLHELEEKLIKYKEKDIVVTITAASNVTGYVNDLKYIGNLVHQYNGKFIVDAAQIVAHKKIKLVDENNNPYIDFFVFSAHKIYAPFGSGAIIALKSILDICKQSDHGGGTVDTVLDNEEILLCPPEKNEPGSPNYFGAVALVKAMKEIRKIGCTNLEVKEKKLMKYIIQGLSSIPEIILYGDNINIEDRLGIVVFNVDGIYNAEVAKMLADYRGIAVRQGAFCAHPYIRRLLKVTEEEWVKYLNNPNEKMLGMIRVSFGMYNTTKEIDDFLNTMEMIIGKNK